MKSLTKAILVAASLLASAPARADVITGGGGLARVIHDATCSGSGTLLSPLVCNGGVSGLTTGTVPVAASPTTLGNGSLTDNGAGLVTDTLASAGAAGRADALYILDNETGLYTAGDGPQIHFGGNVSNYNTYIAQQWTATTPSFLDPKLAFYIQNAGTTGTTNVTNRFQVTNAGADVTGALTVSGTATLNGNATLGTGLSNTHTIKGSVAVNTDDLSVNASTHQVYISGEMTSGTLTSRGSSTFGAAGTDNETAYGHMLLGNGTTPTVSSCGVGGSLTRGNDMHGLVATGTSNSTCTVTFSRAWSSTPDCTVSPFGAADSTLKITAESTTALTFSITGAGGYSVSYRCSN